MTNVLVKSTDSWSYEYSFKLLPSAKEFQKRKWTITNYQIMSYSVS